MKKKYSKKKVSLLALAATGIIIFVCGLLLFMFKPTDESIYVYALVMAIVGIVFIIFAMVMFVTGRLNIMKEENDSNEKKRRR